VRRTIISQSHSLSHKPLTKISRFSHKEVVDAARALVVVIGDNVLPATVVVVLGNNLLPDAVAKRQNQHGSKAPKQ